MSRIYRQRFVSYSWRNTERKVSENSSHVRYSQQRVCAGSDRVYLLENVACGYARLRTDAEIIELLNGKVSPLILCGHTHFQRTVQLMPGQVIVNPGSVGMPAYTDCEPCVHSMESHSAHASYAMVEKRTEGWLVEQIKVPYDFELAVKASIKRGRDDWAHFLTTGKGRKMD